MMLLETANLRLLSPDVLCVRHAGFLGHQLFCLDLQLLFKVLIGSFPSFQASLFILKIFYQNPQFAGLGQKELVSSHDLLVKISLNYLLDLKLLC